MKGPLAWIVVYPAGAPWRGERFRFPDELRAAIRARRRPGMKLRVEW